MSLCSATQTVDITLRFIGKLHTLLLNKFALLSAKNALQPPAYVKTISENGAFALEYSVGCWLVC